MDILGPLACGPKRPVTDSAVDRYLHKPALKEFHNPIEVLHRQILAEVLILRNIMVEALGGAMPLAEINELLCLKSQKWQSCDVEVVLKERLGATTGFDLVCSFRNHLKILKECLCSIHNDPWIVIEVPLVNSLGRGFEMQNRRPACAIHDDPESATGSQWIGTASRCWLTNECRCGISTRPRPILQGEIWDGRLRQALEDLRQRNERLRLTVYLMLETPKALQSKPTMQVTNDVRGTSGLSCSNVDDPKATVSGTITLMSGVNDNQTECETEPQNEEEQTLGYLDLTIEATNKSTGALKETALLDTGATHCAISYELAQKLELDVKQDDTNMIVRTAAQGQNLAIAGKGKVKFRWNSSKGGSVCAKLWVFVVHGMSESIILSKSFIQKHSGLWDIANERKSGKVLLMLYFGKQSKELKEIQEKKRAQRFREIRAKAESKKASEDIKEPGNAAQTQPLGSQAGSASGS